MSDALKTWAMQQPEFKRSERQTERAELLIKKLESQIPGTRKLFEDAFSNGSKNN